MFKLKENQTNAKTEVLAGITTFLTMVYIVVVNPVILSDAGVPFEQVFTATIVAAIVGTLWMAIFANYPIAIAPGIADHAASCGRVPCTGQYINWLGFITIPFLALIAFIIIFICSYLLWKKSKEAA